MKVNSSDFAGSKKFCIDILKERGKKEIHMLSVTAGVPLVVLGTWYLKEIEEDEEVKEMIERLTDFYQYTEIID
jgi:hypothetical protein